MRTQIVREGQTIWDLALEQYGSVDGVFNIISDNPDVGSVDHIFQNGDEIDVDDTAATDQNTKDFYASRLVVPVSGEEDAPGGDFNDDFNDDFNI